MVQINLLPPQLKKKKEKQVLERQMLPAALFLGGLAVLLTLIWLALMGSVAAKRSQLASLDNDWRKIEKDIRRLNELKTTKKNLENRANFINRIVGREIRWAEFLNALSDSLPSGVWFTSVSIESKKDTYRELKIDGQAGSLGTEEMVELIESLVNNLQATEIFSNNFGDIKLETLTRVKIDRWDTMKFKLTSKMR